jgi:hypothetical protein
MLLVGAVLLVVRNARINSLSPKAPSASNDSGYPDGELIVDGKARQGIVDSVFFATRRPSILPAPAPSAKNNDLVHASGRTSRAVEAGLKAAIRSYDAASLFRFHHPGRGRVASGEHGLD